MLAIRNGGGTTPGMLAILNGGGTTPGMLTILNGGGTTPGMLVNLNGGGTTPGMLVNLSGGGTTPGIEAWALDANRTQVITAAHEAFHDENISRAPQRVQRDLLGKITQTGPVDTTKVLKS
jgi:hypothetical protein